jgi:hypothetical protein
MELDGLGAVRFVTGPDLKIDDLKGRRTLRRRRTGRVSAVAVVRVAAACGAGDDQEKEADPTELTQGALREKRQGWRG